VTFTDASGSLQTQQGKAVTPAQHRERGGTLAIHCGSGLSDLQR
jgi:hypothetical protein